MSIISRTFITVPGLNYVEDTSFGGAIFFGVKRSGLGLTRITSGTPTNDEFLVSVNRIYVDVNNPFNAGEKIWVLYTGPQTPPPSCTVPTISTPTDNLPAAIAGVAYVFTIAISGTAPFTLSAITKPSWMSIAVVGSNLEFTGTPGFIDVGTNIPVLFTINNCSGSGVYAVIKAIDVLTPSGNGTFEAENGVVISGNFIKNIFPYPPFFYTLTSGSLPVGVGQTASGFMILPVSAAVEVFVIIVAPITYQIEIYKNGVLAGSVIAPMSGTYALPVISFLITDSMKIKLTFV